MSFEEYLKQAAAEVNDQLGQFFDSWDQEVSQISPKLTPLKEEFQTSCQGGKRLRGALVKLGFEIALGKDSIAPLQNDIMKAAAAFELFQTAILAQDDIVDKSPLRRGKPTLYKALGGDHYGISQTMILGDVGFFVAHRLIERSNFEDKYVRAGSVIFTQMMIDTAIGEALDIELPHLGQGSSIEEILTIFRLKTSNYTIVGPLQLGASLAGADQKMLAGMAKFGRDLGLAFQIQDDILGVFGEEEETGKSVTSDVEEGKMTLLWLEAQKKANSDQSAELAKLYGQGPISPQQLTTVRQIFTETGALDYSKQKALEYTDTAKKSIADITFDPRYQELLMGLANMLINRQK